MFAIATALLASTSQSLARRFESWSLILSHSAQLKSRLFWLPFLKTASKLGDAANRYHNVCDPFWLWLPWFRSAGSEDEKQNSKEVLSTLLFFLLLMPPVITFRVWKEATHLLVTLLIRTEKVLESSITHEFFNSETQMWNLHYLSDAAQ